METRFEPLSDRFVPAVKSFNARLAAGGVMPGFFINDSPAREHEREAEKPAVFKEQFVVVRDGEVHGGYILQHQPVWVRGAVRNVVNYQMPISEGLVDRKYASLGMVMLKHVLREHPLVFAVGMGGRHHPFPRLLTALRWRLEEVPFLFRVHRARRVLRHLRPLRGTGLRRALADLASLTGMGGLAFGVLQRLSAHRPPSPATLKVDAVEDWDEWADEVWQRASIDYSMAGVRNATTLRLLYPQDGVRYLRYRVLHEARVVGWAVVLDTTMRGDQYFGDLRVGTVLDCLAVPGATALVAHAATRELERRGVDLLLTNQAHGEWIRAFRRAGFLTGPSNYLLATSPMLTDMLQPLGEHAPRIHLTRGDGDGRIHL